MTHAETFVSAELQLPPRVDLVAVQALDGVVEVIDDVPEEEGGTNRLITVRLNPKELGQYEALD